jgi:ABC-type Zn uptake system ZnuABC Zn-binding protein ZnuA
VIYSVGHGIDGWVTGLVSDKEKIFLVSGGVSLRQMENDEGVMTADPHYWLDVRNAKIIVADVADDLMHRFPDQAAAVAENLIELQTTLDRTDQEIRRELAGIGSRKMVTLHEAWYYFAEAYGLEIVATFEPSPGREPTPQYLAALGYAIDSADVKTLYSEPQLPIATLRPFLEDNGLDAVLIDPIGDPNIHASYAELMLSNARAIRQGQQ